MYLEMLILEKVRTFQRTNLIFVHPDRTYPRFDPDDPSLEELLPRIPLEDAMRGEVLPRSRYPNVNLLLGDNGSGKSTILRSIALVALGPAVSRSFLQAIGMIRRGEDTADITSSVRLHRQDLPAKKVPPVGPFQNVVTSSVNLSQRGDLEIYDFTSSVTDVWDSVYKTNNESFFVVGYGATRRVERPENLDMGARLKSRFGRFQRIQSLFEDSFSLIPLTYWLPKLKDSNREHYKQVVNLLDAFLKPARYTFSGQVEKGDYLFERGGNRVPFLSMSDGYRAFIGWVADLLYHICSSCSSGKDLVESQGIVMVDEIDLHLHPKWQMTVIRAVARALPRMQFIFTSHSPLVAGSLEWMNIITLKLSSKTNRTIAKRLKESIHGLDADQVLLSDFFGLKTTRAPGKVSQLEELERKARHGDQEAARKIILAMSRGMEEKP